MRKTIFYTTGDNINGLIFIEETEKKFCNDGKAYRMGLFQCCCGKKFVCLIKAVRYGNTTSCGCLQKEKARIKFTTHGLSTTPEYRIWAAIKSRCLNEHDPAFENYGDRGIVICDRWLLFKNFILDIGLRPTKNHSVERINNDGNYEPSNCKWATVKEQSRNKRANVNLTLNGKTMCITDWARETGLSTSAINGRLKRHWSVEETLTIPKRTIMYSRMHRN